MTTGRVILIFSIFFSLLSGYAIATEGDPFDSLLPSTSTGTEKPKEKIVEPPAINIEGALWGSDMPQAIIDGEVYKVGDTLKSVDAKIYKIEKNKVFIFYEGRLFEMKVSSKKEAK